MNTLMMYTIASTQSLMTLSNSHFFSLKEINKQKNLFIKLTSSEKQSKPIPTGINAIPITKNVGKTVPAVNIGCQAGNLCCLKADSEIGLKKNIELIF